MRVTVKDKWGLLSKQSTELNLFYSGTIVSILGVELVSIRQCKNGIVCGLLQYRTDSESYRDPVTGGKIPS